MLKAYLLGAKRHAFAFLINTVICIAVYFRCLNSCGVISVMRLKNLQKKLGLGKFSSSAICAIGVLPYFSIIFALVISARSIHSLAVIPLVSFITTPRYRGVTHILSA